MRSLLMLGAFMLLLAACDSQIEPIADGAEGIFSVHGFLDTAADTQYVRIAPMRFISDEPLDYSEVAVRTRDLSTGELTDWEFDASPDLEDGSRIYRGFFRPEPGRSYRIETGRLPDLATRATTRIPDTPDFQPGPIQGTSSYVVQSMSLMNRLEAPYDLSILYTILPQGYSSPITVPIEYGPVGNEVGGNWLVSVHYSRDREAVKRRAGLPDTIPITLIRVRADLDILSEEWPFPYPPVLGGHGHFASVARFSISWPLDPDVLTSIGWMNGQTGGKQP